MHLKVDRIIALDELLLKAKRNKIVGRRMSMENAAERPKKIVARRNTAIDKGANQPKSILWTSKFKDIPFSRIGRRRKSVTFDLSDNEENNPKDAEPSMMAENHAVVEPLIQFDDNQIVVQSASPNLASVDVLKSIGFDGPVENPVHSVILTPTVANSLQKGGRHVTAKRPIPELIPMKTSFKRRSIAADIVMAACNTLLVENDAHTMKINFDIPEFGILKYDD